ncbi:MAG: putative fructose,6-bisphosphatase [Pseudomonadota bacterium]|jgi:fructose-1,6-bisphosphatase I
MITLTQFIIDQQRQFSGVSGHFTGLLNAIAMACKRIAHIVNRGDLIGVLGNSDSENIQGEIQKKLDIITHQLMVDTLINSGHLAGMVSEEAEQIIKIPPHFPKDEYLVLFDPLDGSSNIDVNLTVGTIFSIIRAPKDLNPELKDFLKSGREQVCAGFVLYGPSTLLILTTGQGVNGFTLDKDIGEFILTHSQIHIPEQTQEFAINLSNQRFWQPPIQRYVNECLQGTQGIRGKNFNMRWLASLVAEVYRILMRGGVFMYPYDLRQPQQAGRLRLLYEANPIAWIVEQAGGLATTGTQSILEIQPESLHQRVPLILGSKQEIERIIDYHRLLNHNLI